MTSSSSSSSHGYAIAVCIFASLGGIFFGYDQGVTGGVLVMPSFLEDFCIGYDASLTNETCTAEESINSSAWLTFTTLFNVTYYIGCIAGAFGAHYIADYYGRRCTIFTSALCFTSGTAWVIATPASFHTLVLTGRVLEGVGVGASSFVLPIYGAEMAPTMFRGMLSGFMQMTVVSGLLLAGIANSIVENMDSGWRITNGIVLIVPVVIMLGVFTIPESPRWLYRQNRQEDAKAALIKLRRTTDVSQELNAIADAAQDDDGSVSFMELWCCESTRKRIMIATSLQCLQQATGINPMFTYGGVLFQSIIPSGGIMSLLVLQIVNFLSTMPALYWVDRFGRRSLLLLGGAGMVLGHVCAALFFTFGCETNTEDDSSTCSNVSGIAIVTCAAFFIFNFAISWGPVCWIYPAEIFPTRVRAKAVALSTMTNWSMGALMIGIPKLFPLLRINGVFFLFGVLCTGAACFVYVFCPETKGVALEDIQSLFDARNTPKNGVLEHESSFSYRKAASSKK